MRNPSIILATVNARYIHSAFGLRYLWANLGPLREQAGIREFTLGQPPPEIVESLLGENPRIVAFGVYIWNVSVLTQVVQTLKAVRPEVVVVLGGPEASHDYEETDLFAASDYLIRGEADLEFARLAQAVLSGQRPAEKVITAESPDLAGLSLPYDAYSDEDVAKRIVYVEASRGCPFRCDFCLSSLEPRVREFPLDPFLKEMARLIERGGRRFKFVDRTFNLDYGRVEPILRFLLGGWRDGMQVHFEILPDRLDDRIIGLLAQFPPRGLHLEVGVQTLNAEAQAAVSRSQDLEKSLENIALLRARTGALIHADLVLGLPGESWDTLAAGFDRLIALQPHELQVGILKRLKGTPIARADALVFARHPPYEVLQTDRLSFDQLQRLKRFARYFDLYYNSGNFPRTLLLLWRDGRSPFGAFMDLADSLWSATRRTHEFSLAFLAQHLHQFLVQSGAADPQAIAEAVEQDFHRLPGRKDKLRLSPRESQPVKSDVTP